MKHISLLLSFLVLATASFASDFITIWDLSKKPTAKNSISFRIKKIGTVRYTWQKISGTYQEGSGSFTEPSCSINNLPTAGKIRLLIAPDSLAAFQAKNESDDCTKALLDVEQWGSTLWKTLDSAFKDCSNLQIQAKDVPNLSWVQNARAMFQGCAILNGPENIGTWNTWDFRDVSFLFSGAYAFNQPIGNWKMDSVRTMRGMFHLATSFNQPIGSWKTAKVTDMSMLFYNAKSFNQTIGTWNTSKVTTMTLMFYKASAFAQTLEKWNTSNVWDMSYMFYEATAFNGNILKWRTNLVEEMGDMFYGASSFNQPIGEWNTAKVLHMSHMFEGATSFNQALNDWNTASVKNMSFMFAEAKAFNQDISHWNTANVTDMSAMFQDASSFNQSIYDWNISGVRYMNKMLDNSGLDCSNYSKALIAWAAESSNSDSIALGAQGLHFSAKAVSARDYLRDTKKWDIAGDNMTTEECDTSRETGISESPNASFQVYPNPTRDRVELRFDDASSKDIYLLTMQGKIIETHSAIQAPTYSFDIQQAAGIYILQVRNQSSSTYRKIIKE